MQADSTPDMLAAALAAYDAGICVIRAHTDGSKRPVGEWAQWQEKRPSREQVTAWFANGHAAMGAVCGSVSGDLELFELEGRFMRRFGSKEFTERAQRFGAELTIQRLLSGLVVISPSDGRHFIVRTEGPVDGNTKLANDAEGNTLIETRGEGGFVVLPPSHGTTHATGKAWATARGDFASIITLTADERQRLFALARSYDETPPPAAPKPVSVAQRAKLGRYSGTSGLTSWYDAVVEHLAGAWTMRSLLEHYGWTWCYTDKHGRDLLRRPGKDEGVSGSINGSGRFHPFSSQTPFPGARADKGSPTYDLLDVLAVYEYSGVRDDAARTIADTTGIMQAWRRAEDARMRRTFGLPDEEPPTRAAPPNADPVTGEVRPPQAPSIWDERPILAHIRDAARNRMVSPWAVLGCVLARVAAFTPPSTCLPPLIGGTAPLSLYIGLFGSSGAGKSAPTQCAADLLPDIPPGCIGPLGLGSGEGLVEAYMEIVEETDGGGKKTKSKRQNKRGVLFTLDEGQAVIEMGSRKGSTILPALRTAWSGGDPGQANAAIETRRSLKPNSYAIGLISLWQDVAAASLIADVNGGTPQRFVWLPTTDPEASRNRPHWPGPLDWTPPPAIAVGGITQAYPLGVHEAIEDEILDARVLGLRGELAEDALDAHRRLNKLKVAGVLCVLEGRDAITEADWHLAERILTLSDDVRAWIIAETKRRQSDALSTDAAKAVFREAVAEKSAADRALMRAAKAAWRVVSKADGDAVGRRHITQGINSRDRQLVTVDDAITEAESLKWITAASDGGWVQGEVRPS